MTISGKAAGCFCRAARTCAHDCGVVRGFHLVGLGQHHLKGHGRPVEKRQDFLVHGLDSVAGINQDEGAAQGLAACKIGLEQSLPLFDNGFRGLRQSRSRAGRPDNGCRLR